MTSEWHKDVVYNVDTVDYTSVNRFLHLNLLTVLTCAVDICYFEENGEHF